jgi:zinc protease
MLLRGTASRTYTQFQKALDELGIAMSTSLTIDGVGFSTQALATDEPKALALIADMLQRPRFAQSDFADAQSQLIADRRTALSDPLTVSREALYRGLYPAHSAWSLPSEGTIDSLGKLGLPDARAFYATHYAPNNTIIVVSGDADPNTLRQQVQTLFGTWRKAPAPRPNLTMELAPPSQSRTLTRSIPGATRVEVFAGAPGLRSDAPDVAAAQLMGFILGGGSFISRLLHQVRDVDGYVYNISARFIQSSFGSGPWTLHFGASPQNVKLALGESVEQMRALQRETISEPELVEYRRLAVDAVLTGELNNQGIADELLRDETLGRGLDYPSNLASMYAAITPAQIQTAAQTYLHPDNLLISAAGAKF